MIIFFVIWCLIGLFTAICMCYDDWHEGQPLYFHYILVFPFLIVLGLLGLSLFMRANNTKGPMYYKVKKFIEEPLIKGRKDEVDKTRNKGD